VRLGEAALGQLTHEGANRVAATAALAEAVELHPSPPGDWSSTLAAEFAASDAAPGAVDSAYRAAILANPGDERLVETWIGILRAREADADDHLVDLQSSSSVPLVGVLLHLLAGPARDQVLIDLRAPVDTFLAGKSARRCRRVWDDYIALRPLDPAACKALRRVGVADIRLFFLAQPPRMIPLAEVSVEELGLSADALRWYDEVFLTADEPAGRSPVDHVSSWGRLFSEVGAPLMGFQTRLIRDRRLVLRDPHTGVAVAPFDCVVPHGRTIYSFGDRELTMLVAAGQGTKAALIYLARQNVMIDLGSDLLHYFMPRRLANLNVEMLRRVAREHGRFAAALAGSRDPEAERFISLQINYVENPAHHLWNSFPGIEKIIDCGLVDRVDELRVGGSEFYGSLAELFPEFSAVPVIDEERQGIRDPYPFSSEHLLLQPGGYVIRRSLVDRLVRRMSELPASSHLEPPAAAERPFPIVWIGLRVGSRSWVDQEHEVPRLIDAIHAVHGEALVVLDGFSHPVGRDLVTERWSSAIEQLARLSATIRSASGRPQQVVDMVGNSLRESVLWAAATDVYLAPIGSSQHKVGWLTDGPGIAYAPMSLGKVEVERRPGAWEAEGRPMPVTLLGTVESAGERRFRADHRYHLENIRLDPDEVVATMLRLIDERRRTIRDEHVPDERPAPPNAPSD
jgi:hypothetical protein